MNDKGFLPEMFCCIITSLPVSREVMLTLDLR